MKNRALALVATMLLAGSGMAMAQYYGQPAPPPQYGPGYGQGGWEQAPPDRRDYLIGFRRGLRISR